METVTSRSPQEAWIINLICSTEQGKAPLLSGTIQINSKYEREILPAPFEKKILKKMGYSNTADGMFANGFGHRTTTGVIFADHVNHRIFLCVPSHFFMFDEGARNALQLTSQQTTALQIYGGLRDHKQSGAWWMDLPVNNVQYLATALENPQLVGYQVHKVIFKVDKDLAAWNTKKGSDIQIEESETADELMEFLSGKQLRKSPSTEIETKTPSAPTGENQNIKCPKCGTRVDKQDAKFCINCGAGLNPESKKTSKQYIEEGQEFEYRRMYAEAIRSYDKALALEPNQAAVWGFRGHLLDSLGRYEEALESYDRAIAIVPVLSMLWTDRAKILIHLGRFNEAVESSDKAISLDSGVDSSWFHRGDALARLGQFDEAKNSFDKALAINPNNADFWFHRGMVLGFLEKHVEAVATYDRAIALKPESAESWFFRSMQLSVLDRSDEAQASFLRAKAIDPVFVDTMMADIEAQKK